ncbi:hypothetical protein DPMN_109706 [Dreissena polymorpha]|uniref:Uncharacterized protein n=1 Tax=Dreissena polymorpha TaxID=45954 RepID=A0A9D4KBN0_DREPO|nr:hypothetical protein DPMN_109706 [Dreissena polymorpha]
MLASCLILWSGMSLLTGFIKVYWQLVQLRFGSWKSACKDPPVWSQAPTASV